MAEWTPGQHAVWLWEPRGGYGYVLPVDAVVVRASAKRVLIRVRRANGPEVERWVRPESLRELDASAARLADLKAKAAGKDVSNA